MKKRRLLTIDDLVNFCKEQNFTTFSSKEIGETISVQLPSRFELDEYNESEGLLKVRFKVFHTGKNLNGSYISKENAERCMRSIKLRPILANIHQLEDGTWDFLSHDLEIEEDSDGEERVNYIEKQVGCFTEEEPYLEQDEKDEKKYFVIANAVIPEEYTRTAEILKEKGGTKVSVELEINKCFFDKKKRVLEIEDFYINGCTLLGSFNNAKGETVQVQEAMRGSRADICDFSTKNNSVHFENKLNKELIERLSSENDMHFNNELEKGGNEDMNKFEELLKKYNKTVEDIDFEYETMNDEDLENKFSELFGEELNDASGLDLDSKDSAENKDKKFTVKFELSAGEIYETLNSLISSFRNLDNCYYYITDIYKDYFVFANGEISTSRKVFGCKYSVENDTISLIGDRYALHEMYLTDEEKASIEEMRTNYESIKEELNTYKLNELKAQKEEVLAEEPFAQYSEEEEFKELRNSMDSYSLDEFKDRANIAFAKCVKRTGAFSLDKGTQKSTKKNIFTKKEVKTNKRYGNIFDK